MYFLKLGAIGFGGPVALTGYMQRDLVEHRAWITPVEYKDGLALAQLAPGPLAAQLAIYIGFVHYGVLGASLVAIAFVIPSFIIVVVGGYLYVTYAGLTWIQDVFYAVGAAVIGIIANSAYKLVTRTVGKDPLLLGITAVLAVHTAATRTEEISLILAAGVLVFLVRTPPRLLPWATATAVALWLPTLGALPRPIPKADSSTLVDIAVFFSKAGAFVFGSGLAIVPFLYSGVVEQFGWLNEQEFLDAVAVASSLPARSSSPPAFIGFLVAGFPGATIAAVATFLPCYLFTIVPAPGSANTASALELPPSSTASQQPPSAPSPAPSSSSDAAPSLKSPPASSPWSRSPSSSASADERPNRSSSPLPPDWGSHSVRMTSKVTTTAL